MDLPTTWLRLGAIDAAPGYIVSLSSVEEISQNHRDFGAARPGCDKSMRPGSWQSAAGRSRHAGARNARPITPKNRILLGLHKPEGGIVRWGHLQHQTILEHLS